MKEIPDRTLPDGDLYRILRTMKKKRGMYLDNVLIGDNPRPQLDECTDIRFHDS